MPSALTLSLFESVVKDLADLDGQIKRTRFSSAIAVERELFLSRQSGAKEAFDSRLGLIVYKTAQRKKETPEAWDYKPENCLLPC